jgi:hypothetical protein
VAITGKTPKGRKEREHAPNAPNAPDAPDAPDAPIAGYRAQDEKNVGREPQLMNCEAQRDLVLARARQALSQCQNQRNRLARPTEPEF